MKGGRSAGAKIFLKVPEVERDGPGLSRKTYL